jgi:hypothetical protein
MSEAPMNLKECTKAVTIMVTTIRGSIAMPITLHINTTMAAVDLGCWVIN